MSNVRDLLSKKKSLSVPVWAWIVILVLLLAGLATIVAQVIR